MGAGRKTSSVTFDSCSTQGGGSSSAQPPERDLQENLGGVIFGCTNETMAGARARVAVCVTSRVLRAHAARAECLNGMLFGAHAADRAALPAAPHWLRNPAAGLPSRHWDYVRFIEPGMPLFLFNYTGATRCFAQRAARLLTL